MSSHSLHRSQTFKRLSRARPLSTASAPEKISTSEVITHTPIAGPSVISPLNIKKRPSTMNNIDQDPSTVATTTSRIRSRTRSRSNLFRASSLHSVHTKKAAALGKIQARLYIGTDYIPVYELHERQVSSAKKGQKPIRILTYIRLDPKGLVFSIKPSIQLLSRVSLPRVLQQPQPDQQQQSGQSPKKPSIERTPSTRSRFIAWAELDHLMMRGPKVELYLKSATASTEPSSDIIRLKFLNAKDRKAFFTAGLIYGYFNNDKITQKVFGDGAKSTSSSTSGSSTVTTSGPRKFISNLWMRLKNTKETASNSAEESSPSKRSPVEGGSSKARSGGRQSRSKRINGYIRWATNTLLRRQTSFGVPN